MSHFPRKFQYFVPFVLLVAAGQSLASGLDQLKGFLAETHSAQGSFSQTLVGRTGKKPVQSTGEFAFERPGKFRWTYEKPFRQLMVSDGKTLWSYDPELQQVAIKKIGNALGASPAGLLAGGNLEKYFDLRDAGVVDGIESVDATPHGDEAIFQRVRIGLTDKMPVYMEIYDNFGQTTFLKFTRIDRNAKLPGSTFNFAVPKGTEVIRE